MFPEGGITRTGEIQPFKRGLLAVVKGSDVPIIPVFLGGLWGSIFSFEGGRFFWKIPRRLPYPVSVYFGPPLAGANDLDDVRRAVEQLRARAVEKRTTNEVIPPKAFLRTCREHRKKLLLVDTLGEKMTAGQALLRTLILRRLLLREVLAPDEKYVGILIPPSGGSVLVNAVMPLAGRIGVNLNYTLSEAEIEHCIRECGIRHVLTTRKVIEKLSDKFKAIEKLKERCEQRPDGAQLVYLDDLRGKLRLSDKLAGAYAARFMPLGMLERRLGLDRIQPDDVLTVIFTSGSTAMPKGVMLTHGNVGSNVWGIDALIKLRENDVIAGALPFFHSLGYTTTMWTPLMMAVTGAYHVSPLDYQLVGKLCRHAKGTILITTPTFLRGYLKRCQPEDFVTLDVVVAGAEKLPSTLCDAFEKKFGVRPVEGYGTTELSPLVSCNIPPDRRSGSENRLREGSVGRTIPDVEAKVVDPDALTAAQPEGWTPTPLPPEQEGMLLVRGPNVMRGYLNHPEKTAEVIRGGWYVTGDMARIDEDGFIFITGRLSRFSKIGGEMVPHLKVEEEIQRILGKDEELKAAVTAVPDEAKGERLVVLHLPLDKDPEQIRKELLAAGLPNLFVPSRDSFCLVDEIPVLGSGKLDLKAVKRLALERFGAAEK
jgi:acyl-[acyl-carrier-protein]-phospholipid O-acyltransferase/long-chain-fatty-acid--[acyl-carrier-protein] ligase